MIQLLQISRKIKYPKVTETVAISHVISEMGGCNICNGVWENGNVIYFDWVGDCMDVHTCQNPPNHILKIDYIKYLQNDCD